MIISQLLLLILVNLSLFLRPTRPLVDVSRTRPYQSRYNTNGGDWGSFTVVKTPGVGGGGEATALPFPRREEEEEEAGTPKDGTLQV